MGKLVSSGWFGYFREPRNPLPSGKQEVVTARIGTESSEREAVRQVGEIFPFSTGRSTGFPPAISS